MKKLRQDMRYTAEFRNRNRLNKSQTLPLDSVSWVKLFGSSCTLPSCTCLHVYQNKLRQDGAVPWLRGLLTARASSRSQALARGIFGGQTGTVMDKLERWQTVPRVLQFSTVSIIPPCSSFTHTSPTLYNASIKTRHTMTCDWSRDMKNLTAYCIV